MVNLLPRWVWWTPKLKSPRMCPLFAFAKVSGLFAAHRGWFFVLSKQMSMYFLQVYKSWVSNWSQEAGRRRSETVLCCTTESQLVLAVVQCADLESVSNHRKHMKKYNSQTDRSGVGLVETEVEEDPRPQRTGPHPLKGPPRIVRALRARLKIANLLQIVMRPKFLTFAACALWP